MDNNIVESWIVTAAVVLFACVIPISACLCKEYQERREYEWIQECNCINV